MRILLKSARLAWLLACTDPASCWRHRHCLSRDCHRLSVFVSMVGLMMMLRIAWFSFLKNGWNIRFCGWFWQPRLEWKHCLTSKTLSVHQDWIGMEKSWAETLLSPSLLLSQKCDFIRGFFKWILWSIIKRSGLWSAKARASLHFCSTRTSST